MNNITIIGTLKFDPRVSVTQSGRDVANLLVKIDRASGKGFDDMRVSCWGDVAKKAKGLRKGAQVAVAGAMENRRFEKEGAWQDSWQLDARSVTLLGGGAALVNAEPDEDLF